MAWLSYTRKEIFEVGGYWNRAATGDLTVLYETLITHIRGTNKKREPFTSALSLFHNQMYNTFLSQTQDSPSNSIDITEIVF